MRRGKRNRRIAALCAVGAVLTLAAGLCVNFFFWLPTGSGPAGPPVRTEAFAEVWDDRPVLVLGLGDSITTGFGAPPGRGYFWLMVDQPPDDPPEIQGCDLKRVFPNLTARNIAENGTTSLDHERRQIPEIGTQPDDVLGVVFLTTGGNDLIHMYGRIPPTEGAMYGATLAEAEPWIANFAERLDRMLGDIAARFPGGCHIFLANIYDPSDGVGSFARVHLPDWPDGLEIHRRYNEIIAAAAEKHAYVHLVDIRTPFLGHGIYCRQPWRTHYDAADPHYWYYVNLEDPNARGYDAIRRVMLNKMAEVFGK